MKFFYILQKKQHCLVVNRADADADNVIAQLVNDGFEVKSEYFLADSENDARIRWLQSNASTRDMVGLSGSNDDFSHELINLVLFPIKLLWNLIVIIGIIWLEIMWLGFLFGSVLGCVLMLIFMPPGFLLPLGLSGFLVELWPTK